MVVADVLIYKVLYIKYLLRQINVKQILLMLISKLFFRYRDINWCAVFWFNEFCFGIF